MADVHQHETVLLSAAVSLSGKGGKLFSGCLSLSNERLFWCPEGSRTPAVSLPLSCLAASPQTSKGAEKFKMRVSTKSDAIDTRKPAPSRAAVGGAAPSPSPAAAVSFKPHYVFEFMSPTVAREERDGFRDLIVQLLAAMEPPVKPAATDPATATAGGDGGVRTGAGSGGDSASAPGVVAFGVARERSQALADNAGLRRAHLELVGRGTMTEAEFWASRPSSSARSAEGRSSSVNGPRSSQGGGLRSAALLRALPDAANVGRGPPPPPVPPSTHVLVDTAVTATTNPAALRSSAVQPTGFRSALEGDVRPEGATGGGGGDGGGGNSGGSATSTGAPRVARYRLTPSRIRAIFAEYPAVQQAYSQTVPEKMTERAFWIRYFTTKHFYQPSSTQLTLAGQSDEDDLFARTVEQTTQLRQELPAERRSVPRGSPLDLAANDDPLQLPGPPPDAPAQVPVAARKLNQHGSLVLASNDDDDGGDSGGSSPAGAGHSVLPARKTGDDGATTSAGASESTGTALPTFAAGAVQARRYNPVRSSSSALRQRWKKQAQRRRHAAQQADGDGPGTLFGRRAAAVEPQSDLASNKRRKVDVGAANRVNAQFCRLLEQRVPALRVDAGPLQPHVSPVTESLPVPTARQVQFSCALQEKRSAGEEFLRHYWAHQPPTGPADVEKCRRIKECVSALFDEVEDLREAEEQASGSHVAAIAVPILQTFQVIL